ncbi:MAG: hypothetical protein J5822_06285 [Eubacteriaceae bacterium]|nr:hypothetical protein [Eubacteriaceae bacterium]
MKHCGVFKALSVIILCLMLACSCSLRAEEPAAEPAPERTYSAGYWEAGVYTNPSLGFSLTLPDGASVRSDPASLLEGTGIQCVTEETDIFSGGVYCETAINDSSGNCCAVLLVTDCVATCGVAMNPADYAQLLIRDIQAPASTSLSGETIAGTEYTVFRYPEGGDVYNTYFVGERDGITFVWILSSHGRQRPSPEEMIRSLESTEPPAEQTDDSGEPSSEN